MNNIGKIILSTLVVCQIGAFGCRPVEKNDASKTDNRPVVYASFYPLYDFTQKIGGDKIQVFSLIKPGIKAHDWDPAPRDLAELSKANLLICNGMGMEPWLHNAVEAVGNPNLAVVEAGKGIAPLAGGCGHECSHHASHAGESCGHAEELTSDPHIWLSPINVKIILKNIAEALCAQDPANKEYYQNNLKKWIAECDELDAKFHRTLDLAEQKNIVVSHQAFGYLCKEYGLNQIAVEGLTAQADPSMSRMAEIVKEITNLKIRVVFVESSSDSRISDVLAQETGVKTDVLNPYETLYEQQIEAGDDYFSIMNQNLKALQRALIPPTPAAL